MKTQLVLGAIIASMMMLGCGSNDNDTNTTTDTRFTTTEMMEDTVRIDSIKKLEWVGSAGNGACVPHGAANTEMADIASAKAHCDALEFAGHDDWRTATANEHADFIKGMKEEKLTPFYANPACPRLIGVDGSAASAVNTHNSTPVGDKIPWATLLTLNATNFGIKCVRDQ